MNNKTSRVEEIRHLMECYNWTFKQIAEALNLSYSYVRRLASEGGVYRYGPRKGNSFVTPIARCPECGGELRFDKDTGEKICEVCGLVVERVEQFSEALPFDTTGALVSSIAFGKSLGGTAPKIFKVIARAPAGTLDLPIRATQIQVISNSVDPPIVRNMLKTGSHMLRELGLDRDTDDCHAFADRYGAILRKLGAFIQISKAKIPTYMVARAALFYLLKDVNLEKANEARKKYPFHGRYLNIITMLQKILEGESKK